MTPLLGQSRMQWLERPLKSSREKRSSHGLTAIADVKSKHRLATRVILRLGEDVFVPSTCRRSETPARTSGSPFSLEKVKY